MRTLPNINFGIESAPILMRGEPIAAFWSTRPMNAIRLATIEMNLRS